MELPKSMLLEFGVTCKAVSSLPCKDDIDRGYDWELGWARRLLVWHFLCTLSPCSSPLRTKEDDIAACLAWLWPWQLLDLSVHVDHNPLAKRCCWTSGMIMTTFALYPMALPRLALTNCSCKCSLSIVARTDKCQLKGEDVIWLTFKLEGHLGSEGEISTNTAIRRHVVVFIVWVSQASKAWLQRAMCHGGATRWSVGLHRAAPPWHIALCNQALEAWLTHTMNTTTWRRIAVLVEISPSDPKCPSSLNAAKPDERLPQKAAKPIQPPITECAFFWYWDVPIEVSRWLKSPFWYRELFLVFCCSATRSSSSWDELLYVFLVLGGGINILYIWRSQKISILTTRSKNLDSLKKTSRDQLTVSPISVLSTCLEALDSLGIASFWLINPLNEPWRPKPQYLIFGGFSSNYFEGQNPQNILRILEIFGKKNFWGFSKILRILGWIQFHLGFVLKGKIEDFLGNFQLHGPKKPKVPLPLSDQC